MTTSRDLLLAILAMDSYNRGYGQGITGLDAPNAQIGDAIFLKQSDIKLDSAAVSSGFYAAAYDTPYGKVISYRGTDNYLLSNPTTGGNDIVNGWISALVLR